MKYMLTIYGEENAMANATPEQIGQVMDVWTRYTKDMEDSGAMVAGEGLQPTATATTVRGENGKAVTTDGPFAETKEQLGGFYLIDVNDLDEAIDWASKMPGVDQNQTTVEVRPVMNYDPPQ